MNAYSVPSGQHP